MSESIVEKYITTTPIIAKARAKTGREWDKIFKNQTFHNCNKLLYLELSHTMNAGDIGQLEATFLPLIYMIGKHKYSSQMLQFIIKM